MKPTSKSLSASAIVALLTATLATTALSPAAYAQSAPSREGPGAVQMQGERGHMQRPGAMGQHRNGMDRRSNGGLGTLIDFGASAERLEIALVRLAYAIDMSDEQQALFETLRTDALAAQAGFETATEGLLRERGVRPAAGERPDLVERFDNRIAIDTARLDAMTAVQPAFAAFFSSLSEDQIADLMPRRAMRADRMGGPAPVNAPATDPIEPPATE